MPRRLAEDLRAAGRPVFIVCIREFADLPLYRGLPHQVVRLGAGGEALGCESFDPLVAGDADRVHLGDVLVGADRRCAPR